MDDTSGFTRYELSADFYDEMFDSDGHPHEASRRLSQALAQLAPEELEKLQEGVYRRFLHEGITFTVLGLNPVNRSFPSTVCRAY